MEELKKMLENHDWFYMYADGNGYIKGREERKAINDKIDELIKQGVSRGVIDMFWASVDKGQAA